MAQELTTIKRTRSYHEGEDEAIQISELGTEEISGCSGAVEPEATVPMAIHSIKMIKSAQDVAAEIDDQRAPAYAFSSGFISDFSLVLENKRERAQGKACCDKSITSFSTGNISRNKVNVMASVIMILQHKRAVIRKHDPQLPERPQNMNQIQASIYRSIKLEILEGVMTHLSSDLRALMRLGIGDIPRILRLRWILSQSPKIIRNPLREMMKAGLGTRDVAKVAERGGTDFALSMWLCGLWLLYQKGQLTDTYVSLPLSIYTIHGETLQNLLHAGTLLLLACTDKSYALQSQELDGVFVLNLSRRLPHSRRGYSRDSVLSTGRRFDRDNASRFVVRRCKPGDSFKVCQIS